MNGIYDIARFKLATGALDWRAVDLWLAALSGPADFVVTDTTMASIVGRAVAMVEGVSLPITAKNVAAIGIAQTNQVVIPGIAAGVVVTQFVMALGVPPDAASVPLLWIDDAENLPFTGNGLDVAVQPDWAMQQGWFRP